MVSQIPSDILYTAPAALIAIVLHEFSHGYVSYRLGDPTPKMEGRLSLNPLKHLDLFGTVCLVFFHFGWAKPVQVNPRYYQNPKSGMIKVALAGPVMNFILTFVAMFGYGITGKLYMAGLSADYLYYIQMFFYYLAVINVGLGVFNLIPVPPLDGSKVLAGILPADKYFGYMKYERYGTIALLALLWLGILSRPLGYVTSGIINVMWTVVKLILRY